MNLAELRIPIDDQEDLNEVEWTGRLLVVGE